MYDLWGVRAPFPLHSSRLANLAGTTAKECFSRVQRAFFLAAWTWIGGVSAYDGYLVKHYEVCILQEERNPLALHIIRASGNDVMPFLWLKAAGTLLVLAILGWLYRWAPRLALPVVQGVAGFQFLLLLFIHLSYY
jgi:hypothetical protein